MLSLIVGGSASGKSAWAENVTVTLGEKRVYIATMQPFDEECRKRIEKHRLMRKDKGFETLEVYRCLRKATISNCDVVLLECLSNLLANEFYGPEGEQGAVERILSGVEFLCQNVREVVIVSNEVFCDGDLYSEETLRYMEALGRLNRRIAERAEVVAEVCCGEPIFHKGSVKYCKAGSGGKDGSI